MFRAYWSNVPCILVKCSVHTGQMFKPGRTFDQYALARNPRLFVTCQHLFRKNYYVFIPEVVNILC